MVAILKEMALFSVVLKATKVAGSCSVGLGGRPGPPRAEGGPKSRKVLRKPLIMPHFWKSQILRLKQGFPLLAGPLFCESKVVHQGLSGDRPEPAEGGSGGVDDYYSREGTRGVGRTNSVG